MLTPDQKRRVDYIVNYRYVDEESSDELVNERVAQALAAVESAEELHHIAAHFNWDCGLDYLRDVIRHPKCDAGTALMLYWLAQPDYWYRDPSRLSDAERGTEIPEELAFVREIEDRYLAGQFASKMIRVDPRDLFQDDAVAYYERHARDDDRFCVPERMKQPSSGADVALEEVSSE